MAIITIKGRNEGIVISNETAIEIKKRWIGSPGIAKADKTDILDLGEWCGEYGKISSIEVEKERPAAKIQVEKPISKEEQEKVNKIRKEINNKFNING